MTTTGTATTEPSTTAPPITAVDGFLADIARGAIRADRYAPEAVLDAVVPGWRFTAAGPAAIAAEYGRWFAHPARLCELRRRPIPDGEAVSYTVRWTEDGVPHAAWHAHLLDLGPDGRIVRDEVWCGGRWPADLLAQMGEAHHAH